MAKTTVKSKLKKATLMAGIAAATAMPLKSSAQTTTQDAKEQKVEISINPDQVRENIRVMQIDSINAANYEEYVRKIVETANKTNESIDLLCKRIKDLLNDNISFEDKMYALAEAVDELRLCVFNEHDVIQKHVLKGIATVTPIKSSQEVNEKLLEQRILLKLAENGK